jgi:hypothetical protein
MNPCRSSTRTHASDGRCPHPHLASRARPTRQSARDTTGTGLGCSHQGAHTTRLRTTGKPHDERTTAWHHGRAAPRAVGLDRHHGHSHYLHRRKPKRRAFRVRAGRARLLRVPSLRGLTASISRRRETSVAEREGAQAGTSTEDRPDSPVGCMHLLGSRHRCLRAGTSAALSNATERPQPGGLPRSLTFVCLARRRCSSRHAAALVLPSVAVCCGCSL